MPEYTIPEVPTEDMNEGAHGPERLSHETQLQESTEALAPRELESSCKPETEPTNAAMLRSLRPRRALIGMVSTDTGDGRDAVDGHVPAELEPQDAPPATDAGGGSSQPPIERPPHDGADVPDESGEGDEGRIHEYRVSDGAINEVPTRPVEIHHSEDGRYDVITNLNHPNPELARQVAEQIKNGIPESWTRLPSRSDRAYHVDSAYEPTLFAKTRASVRVESYGDKHDEIDAIELTPEQRAHEKALIRAEHSVLNEMAIAPQVYEAIQEEAVQQIAQAHGYASLTYEGPLAAINDTETGKKIVVYPWQAGFTVQNERQDMPVFRQDEIEAVEDVVFKLGNAMLERGIMPHGLRPSQFREYIDDEGARHLRLTDVDRFAPLTPVERLMPPEFAQGLAPGEIRYEQDYEWHVDIAGVGSDGRPKTFEVSPDGLIAARRSEDISQGPVLQGQLDGGRAIVLWNKRGEGAIAHFSRAMMEEEDAHFRALDELIGKNPTLRRAQMWGCVVGDEVTAPRPMSAWFANDELRTALEELGITNPGVISVGGVHRITLRLDENVDEKMLEIRDKAGNLLRIADESD